MGSKDKKRKLGKTPVASTAATDSEEKALAVAPANEPVPAPAKEAPKPKAAKPAAVLTKKPSRLRFFVDAYLELRKAHWPSRREAMRLSLLVAGVCLVVGIVLGIVDLGFSGLMRLLLFRS